MRHKYSIFILLFLIVAAFSVVCSTPATAAEPKTDAKLIALTFDDGPSAYTAGFLNALRDRNVHVTFFVKGDHLKQYAAVAERAVMEGHELGNHTENHLDLRLLDEESIVKEVTDNEKTLTEITGETHFLVRPPFGYYDHTILSLVDRPLVRWTVDTYDWSIKDADNLTARLVSKAADGTIFLMHDTIATTPQGALNAIDILQAQGYSFVTVSELFARKGLTLEDHTVYNEAPANGIDYGGNSSWNPYYYDEAKLNSHWAIRYIRNVESSGLMVGTGKNEFRPDYPMTRAMFVCVLARMAKADTAAYENPFVDVENGKWYTKAIAWAAANNIVSGTGNQRFSPGANITKEEICTILYRYAKTTGVSVTGTEEKTFIDQDIISRWAKESVSAMTSVGIINGRTGRIGLAFDPQKYATRAETSVIITKYMDYQQKLSEEKDES